MSFTTGSTFSTNSQSLGSVQVPSYRARRVSSAASSMQAPEALREDPGDREPEVREQNPGAPYFKTIKDLRAQIFANTVDNACIVPQVDNACLAADGFRVKYDTELAMRQSVESSIHGLSKVTDDTNVTSLQLETEIEAVKEELVLMKKNHKEEVKGLQAQIASSGLTVEIDAPKSPDLTKIMADIWAQYDELAWKNREELDKY
ncbi:Keratin, type I cytoskeletal 18 [Plecturocebus cupreus]